MTPKHEALLNIGRKMIDSEVKALMAISTSLGDDFLTAVDMILECRGKLILTGMGKSGYIARKIAATLTSTGTPTLFLHPAEAAHGDLGIISKNDVVMTFSYSGETDEVVAVARFAKDNGNRFIAMTGDASSSLARMADVHLNIVVEEEDSVLNIVPTSSTTAQLALGDAIAAALMHARNFRAQDFGHLHPGGYIERRIKMATERASE